MSLGCSLNPLPPLQISKDEPLVLCKVMQVPDRTRRFRAPQKRWPEPPTVTNIDARPEKRLQAAPGVTQRPADLAPGGTTKSASVTVSFPDSLPGLSREGPVEEPSCTGHQLHNLFAVSPQPVNRASADTSVSPKSVGPQRLGGWHLVGWPGGPGNLVKDGSQSGGAQEASASEAEQRDFCSAQLQQLHCRASLQGGNARASQALGRDPLMNFCNQGAKLEEDRPWLTLHQEPGEGQQLGNDRWYPSKGDANDPLGSMVPLAGRHGEEELAANSLVESKSAVLGACIGCERMGPLDPDSRFCAIGPCIICGHKEGSYDSGTHLCSGCSESVRKWCSAACKG
jgi:hypothetical protein